MNKEERIGRINKLLLDIWDVVDADLTCPEVRSLIESLIHDCYEDAAKVCRMVAQDKHMSDDPQKLFNAGCLYCALKIRELKGEK